MVIEGFGDKSNTWPEKKIQYNPTESVFQYQVVMVLYRHSKLQVGRDTHHWQV